MGLCFSFLQSSDTEKNQGFKESEKINSGKSESQSGTGCKKVTSLFRNKDGIPTATFTFGELAAATKNFGQESLLAEVGFGCVYKGRLDRTGQVVAVKQFDMSIGFEGDRVSLREVKMPSHYPVLKQPDRNIWFQRNREFIEEVLMLSLLNHSNLINLIGYGVDGNQQLLVYEFVALGSLEDHLYDLPQNKEPLDWNTRINIAVGVAKGLQYLHNNNVIYRDLKPSNIFLDQGYHPKLGLFGDQTHVSTRMMGPYIDYCPPEYLMTGKLTCKSDIYSFGVVLLELITGQRPIDKTWPPREHNFVKSSKKSGKVDPLLQGRYPRRGFRNARSIANICLNPKASDRPPMEKVATFLSRTYDLE